MCVTACVSHKGRGQSGSTHVGHDIIKAKLTQQKAAPVRKCRKNVRFSVTSGCCLFVGRQCLIRSKIGLEISLEAILSIPGSSGNEIFAMCTRFGAIRKEHQLQDQLIDICVRAVQTATAQNAGQPILHLVVHLVEILDQVEKRKSGVRVMHYCNGGSNLQS